MAPPPPRPADRRSALTTRVGASAALAVGVVTALVGGGCADDGVAPDATGSASVSAPAPVGSGSGSAAGSGSGGEASEGSTEASGVAPEGFTTIRGEVTDAAGEVCEVCLWLADSSEERSRGLMGVTDLGDADGMVFVWSSPTESSFFMFRTPTPLSIAWFSPEGSHVGSADMEPCLDESSSGCERYRPDVAYTVAVEVFQGDLGALGIGPGSTIRLLPDTESPTCTP